jgi:hypothetical protein
MTGRLRRTKKGESWYSRRRLPRSIQFVFSIFHTVGNALLHSIVLCSMRNEEMKRKKKGWASWSVQERSQFFFVDFLYDDMVGGELLLIWCALWLPYCSCALVCIFVFLRFYVEEMRNERTGVNGRGMWLLLLLPVSSLLRLYNHLCTLSTARLLSLPSHMPCTSINSSSKNLMAEALLAQKKMPSLSLLKTRGVECMQVYLRIRRMDEWASHGQIFKLLLGLLILRVVYLDCEGKGGREEG